MQYEWILDVLSDLKAFAKCNGLAALAEQLDDTSLVAAAEIAQSEGATAGGLSLNAEKAVGVYRDASAGENA
ncbi:hypothetical protein DEA8626_03624 [Defluviimonas aquaemixtae]|uniref:Uncharacterized protein n=1 Tax=Albidovulum aquaemixtae TaxID=1542388 RepID=A0A2R8BMP0_9RHOB|nr:hypothetical protein [Defluviimonas aquaemixtae]SPH24572.1 hypothetical protein DEA8626_03624 [Defluviimonas aquaemixtae]